MCRGIGRVMRRQYFPTGSTLPSSLSFINEYLVTDTVAGHVAKSVVNSVSGGDKSLASFGWKRWFTDRIMADESTNQGVN